MSSLLNPFFRATDANGTPISGAKLYTYATGTVTNKATYSNEGLSSANANPVVADSSGYFGAIYLLKDAAYTLVLKDASDVTIWTANGVRPALLAKDDYVTRLQQVASNPLDYGALGDGVADESAYIQQAIDAATGVVDLLGKTYKCTANRLTLRSGLTLRNGTLDFTSYTGNDCIRALGTQGSVVYLSSNATAGDTSIALASVSGIAAGDVLLIKDNTAITGGYEAEMVRVVSVSDPNVTLASPLRASYATADNAWISNLTTVDNVVIEDLTINPGKTGTGNAEAIYAENVDGLTIRNCRIPNVRSQGIYLAYAANVTIAKTAIENGPSGSDGICISHSSNQVVINDGCRILGCTRGIYITQGSTNRGPIRQVWLSDSAIENCTDGMLLTAMAKGLRIDRCYFGGNTDGIHMTSVDDIAIYGCGFVGGTNGINASSPTNAFQFCNFFSGQTGTTVSGMSGISIAGAGSDPGGTFTGGATNAAGVVTTGGGTAAGVNATGGGTSGAGAKGQGGAPNGNGGEFTGDGTGAGVTGTGGDSSGAGGTFTGGAPNGRGITSTGDGTGAGAYVTGGDSNGTAGVFIGGATNGVAVDATGSGSGNAVNATSTTGMAINAVSAGATTAYIDHTKNPGDTALGVHCTYGGNGIYVNNENASASNFAVYAECDGGTGVKGVGSGYYGVVAEGDTTSPSYSAFRIVPQDTLPTVGLVGDICVVSGIVHVCTTAGSFGGTLVWTKVGTQS